MEILRIKRNTRNKKRCNRNGECFWLALSKLHMTEKSISELQDRSIETTQTEEQSEKRMKKAEWYPRFLWHNHKWYNMCVWEYQEEKEKGWGERCKVIAENFPKLIGKTRLQIKKAQGINTKWINTKRLDQHLGALYSNCRKPKTKRKSRKKSRQKHFIYGRTIIIMTSDVRNQYN